MRRPILHPLAAGSIAALLFAVVPASAQPQSPTAPQPADTAKAVGAEDKKLSTFQGIKWGTSLQDARAQLKKRDVRIDEFHSNEKCLLLMDVEVAGYSPDYILMQFGAEGFCQARVMLGKPEKNRAVAFFNEVKEVVKQKYGKPKANVYRISRPYEKGDGFDEMAITEGKAVIVSLWQFKEDKDECALAVRMNDDLHTFLVYEDTKRMEKEIKRDKEERAKKL